MPRPLMSASSLDRLVGQLLGRGTVQVCFWLDLHVTHVYTLSAQLRLRDHSLHTRVCVYTHNSVLFMYSFAYEEHPLPNMIS